ncbi:MAG: RecX family transcriptional regulator [Phycisphaerales bacterium]|nr:RecX family transcriptional regulator [Phycisphaerales bacterium]
MADTVVITAIDVDPSEPGLRLVMAGTRLLGRVQRQLIETTSIRVGDVVDDATRFLLDEAHRLTELRLKAIRSLSRAPASSARLAERLVRGGGDPDDVGTVLGALAEEGILDDLDTARRTAADALRSGPVGRRRLTAVLRKRGFEATVTEHALEEVLATRDAHRDVQEATQRCARDLQSLPRDTAARRLAGRLARRGFADEDVSDAVEAWLAEHDQPPK